MIQKRKQCYEERPYNVETLSAKAHIADRTFRLHLTSSKDKPHDRKSRLHGDLSINFELPDRDPDPHHGKDHGKDKRHQGDHAQFRSIPDPNKVQSMSVPHCHHPRGDVFPGGLRRIEEESDVCGAFAAQIVGVDKFAGHS